MRKTFIYFCFFLFFCDLHAKDIYLDLEVDLPNKSSVFIEFNDQVNFFSSEEMLHGAQRNHVFDVVLYSNVKEAIEIHLSSKESKDRFFCFNEKGSQREIPFYLFYTNSYNRVDNGSIIYSQDRVDAPISRVISIGIEVPKVSQKDIFAGKLSTHFTVILKHIG